MHVGRCLCGDVEFEIHGALAPIEICYCSQCQRAQGTAMASNIPVDASALKFRKGESRLRSYESSPGKVRCFCDRCGSPIFSRRDSVPGKLRIRAGLLDAPITSCVVAHFHVATKPDWWVIGDSRPRFLLGDLSSRLEDE